MNGMWHTVHASLPHWKPNTFFLTPLLQRHHECVIVACIVQNDCNNLFVIVISSLFLYRNTTSTFLTKPYNTMVLDPRLGSRTSGFMTGFLLNAHALSHFLSQNLCLKWDLTTCTRTGRIKSETRFSLPHWCCQRSLSGTDPSGKCPLQLWATFATLQSCKVVKVARVWQLWKVRYLNFQSCWTTFQSWKTSFSSTFHSTLASLLVYFDQLILSL